MSLSIRFFRTDKVSGLIMAHIAKLLTPRRSLRIPYTNRAHQGGCFFFFFAHVIVSSSQADRFLNAFQKFIFRPLIVSTSSRSLQLNATIHKTNKKSETSRISNDDEKILSICYGQICDWDKIKIVRANLGFHFCPVKIGMATSWIIENSHTIKTEVPRHPRLMAGVRARIHNTVSLLYVSRMKRN